MPFRSLSTDFLEEARRLTVLNLKRRRMNQRAKETAEEKSFTQADMDARPRSALSRNG
ncbi:MAG: hypothetical protein ACLVCH_04180 [Roseburia inulinivorans]